MMALHHDGSSKLAGGSITSRAGKTPEQMQRDVADARSRGGKVCDLPWHILAYLHCFPLCYALFPFVTCTFYDIFSTQKRKSHDVQTHFCTRCWDPVFLKTKKNKQGRCYTFSNGHRCNGGPSRQTLMQECMANPKLN